MPWPRDTPRFSDWFQDAPTWQTWTLQHVLGLSWGLPPVGHAWNSPEQRALDPILGACRNDPIRDRVKRLLQINNNSVNMTSKSNICQMKVAVESLIDDHVFPLNQCARLWEEIYFSWSCDWAHCKILSSYEKGSRGVILMLSGPKLYPTYEFLSKVESMKIHAPLITHYCE